MADAVIRQVRIAAVGDLHYGRTSQGLLKPVAAAVRKANADVLVLCGDLTDYGLTEEAAALAKEISTSIEIPVVAVLGNHDYESGTASEVRQAFVDVGVRILDGETTEILGIGFAGVKGFAGGFGRGVLGPWGEEAVKRFVNEAVNEALKLETALARLRTTAKIALLHYAPIADTVAGEPREIYPYLGCSRLEEPLSRYPVTAVFHGHAHHGAAEGKTLSGTPVFNVSLPLLAAADPASPIRIFDVPADNQEA